MHSIYMNKNSVDEKLLPTIKIKNTNTQTKTEAHKQTQKHANKHRNTETQKHTNTQTHKHTHKQTNTQTHNFVGSVRFDLQWLPLILFNLIRFVVPNSIFSSTWFDLLCHDAGFDSIRFDSSCPSLCVIQFAVPIIRFYFYFTAESF